jgi:hypothetical protein
MIVEDIERLVASLISGQGILIVRMRVEIQCGGHSMATHHVI